MSAKRKSFDDWTTQQIRDTFGLQEAAASLLLQQWLAAIHTPNSSQAVILETKRALLARFYRYWNEDELKFQFIAHICDLAQLHGTNYNTFSQRILAATVQKIVLYGRPDLMVAHGQEEPKKPYFFIHEYKPTKRVDDPLGQILAAMLAAQSHNADDLPLFGCIVLGAIWQFVVLEDNQYLVSRNYDATDDADLRGIYAALCQAKVYIEERVNG
jgi:hypothetical protein